MNMDELSRKILESLNSLSGSNYCERTYRPPKSRIGVW